MLEVVRKRHRGRESGPSALGDELRGSDTIRTTVGKSREEPDRSLDAEGSAGMGSCQIVATGNAVRRHQRSASFICETVTVVTAAAACLPKGARPRFLLE
jgi:hypothetical protein